MLRITTLVLSLALSLSVCANAADVEVKGLFRASDALVLDVGIDGLIRRSSELDIDDYNLGDLRDVVGADLKSKFDVKSVMKGFGDIVKDGENFDKMNPIQLASGIANLDAALEREEVLNFLGVSEMKSHLYVFVSYSMSEGMIKSYAREAMWSGAILVV
ncbi:hypothetical protein H4J58_00365 [Colwellia sp. MB3u-70]|uniref:hypothetical protein n=1 Tax=unclassified Colwellia TaxID=196834 RepID=UPI0015F6F595|nr:MULTISPECIES: hypothetical protein [unclassified Colwellia]MBA6292990.1 hypothetical protein [Colwellia sp. MB3u-8]MBA6305596.1 hypothetical protein [Colwellia sp. MB3u-70]